MRVLLVEDNPDILANLYGFLEPLGYTLDSARNGVAGLEYAAKGQYDAIVLDVMLPGLDGLEVCRKLRQEWHQSTPVIMLTARDTIHDKLSGFDCGADDYLVKPFSLVELDARLKALVRRARNAHASPILEFGGLCFNAGTFEAARNGQRLELTPTGYKLLVALLRNAPHVLTREQLEHEVWGDDRPDSDALRTHIHALRQAIDKSFPAPMLRTVHGIGYRLADPNET
jgi:DNA-binding response OmpR family regulator